MYEELSEHHIAIYPWFIRNFLTNIIYKTMNVLKIEHFQLPLSVFKCIKPNLLFINVTYVHIQKLREIKSVPISIVPVGV